MQAFLFSMKLFFGAFVFVTGLFSISFAAITTESDEIVIQTNDDFIKTIVNKKVSEEEMIENEIYKLQILSTDQITTLPIVNGNTTLPQPTHPGSTPDIVAPMPPTPVGPRSPMNPSGDPGVGAIIALGETFFSLVKENSAVINAKSKMAHALPAGITDWVQLQGWSVPKSETHKIQLINKFGMAAVDFEFRISYSYGGNLNGKGAYLSNATVHYKNVKVLWGGVFDADVEISNPVNVGTHEYPVAGLQINVNWAFSRKPISEKKMLGSSSYFIRGNGAKTISYN